jgi:hypothetical protein
VPKKTWDGRGGLLDGGLLIRFGGRSVPRQERPTIKNDEAERDGRFSREEPPADAARARAEEEGPGADEEATDCASLSGEQGGDLPET